MTAPTTPQPASGEQPSAEEVRLVQQRSDFDCGPCCLAMLTGRALDDVLEIIGTAYSPEFGLRHDWRALTSLGFPSGSFIREDLAKDASEWDKKRFRHMAWKRKALLTVPSLNNEGKWHMVYFDGETLYDPSNKKRYEEFDQLEPVEIIIFAPLARTALSKEDRPKVDDADYAKYGLNKPSNTGSDAVLSGAVLSGANLSRADLSDADLSDADLSDADLSDADLSDANLRRADLSRANLRDAVLRDANLRRADLSRANLRDAVLRDANLSGVPKIEIIHQAVYEAASKPDALDMSSWHKESLNNCKYATCGTTHCRAGWVIALAGEAGAAMEFCMGTPAAAALIYLKSDPNLEKIPDFYADNETALADMKRLAEQESALGYGKEKE